MEGLIANFAGVELHIEPEFQRLILFLLKLLVFDGRNSEDLIGRKYEVCEEIGFTIGVPIV